MTKSALKPNILLITLDAFNYSIALQNLTKIPTFRKIRDRGISFENAFSVGPNTFFAFPGIISSIYPYYFGVGIPRGVNTIASLLKQIGYNTALINESNALLTPYYGYDKGMDYQEHFLDKSHDKQDRVFKNIFINKYDKINYKQSLLLQSVINKFKLKVQMNKFFKKILRNLYSPYKYITLKMFDTTECYEERKRLHDEFKLKIEWFISTQFKEPQFLWIHTITNHLPYLPPDTTKFSEDEINHLNYIGLSKFAVKRNIKKLKRLYIESLKTTDKLLEFIINKLAENNLLDNTILIITADHGEEFMECSESYEHNPESSSDDLLHVPLIFYNLSNFLDIDDLKINIPVSTIDIFPTLIDILHFSNREKDKMRGQSLISLINSEEKNIDFKKFSSSRALYSEAWELNNILDKSPGYLHNRSIFTVRYKTFKLKVILERRKGYYVEKEIQLYDWVDNKELDVKDYYEEYITLYSFLINHLYEEYIFTKRIKHEYELQRLRKSLVKIKN